MAVEEKRTVSAPAARADYIDIDVLVARGAYTFARGAVRAGPRALQERDAAVERWLRDQPRSGTGASPSDRGSRE